MATLVTLWSAASLLAAAPNLVRVAPTAVESGKSSRLFLTGDNLEGIVDVWTSFACEVEIPEANTRTVEVSLPKNSSAGVGALRLVTTNGLSALQFVLIDPMPSSESVATNHSLQSAQLLPHGTAVDGVCEEMRSDFFRINAKKGERIVIEAVAQRLGSPLDPLLRLIDAAGREIAFSDDTPDLGSDAKMEVRAPKSGEYYVEVRDNRHTGGPRHRYRLRFGDPLPAQLPFLTSKELGQLISPVQSIPVRPETEPNDSGDQSQSLAFPAEIHGRFAKAGDRDLFRFNAKKGERIVFTGRTRSLGSHCDLYLQIQSTNGTKVAEANPTGGDEGALTNRFADSGTYFLVVEELSGNAGAQMNYQVSAELLRPGFAASTETDRISGPAGDGLELEVKVERRDYGGPITFHARGLPATFKLENHVLGAKTNATKLRIIAPDDLALGDHFEFNLIARATDGETAIETRLSTMPALRASFPMLRYPPHDLDGLISLSISGSKSTNPKPPQKKKRK